MAPDHQTPSTPSSTPDKDQEIRQLHQQLTTLQAQYATLEALQLERLEQLTTRHRTTTNLSRAFEMNELLFDLVTVLAARTKRLKAQLQEARQWVH
ncbi:hypothetical protein SAMN04515647_4291 [Cohaesibacter sp. ES.047]|uniref:hypothetical protein n=1 Tax=Cohaesibacter sp. ES.047 TaxID=1798205 RepID=UPI000BB7CE32|nr:hypothetical protein [Cohaesibacter sp. ES.047]SNY93968.1 hypothetical protein SAMN04515647_4291 [Cohaesibacter sp. ES.047]